MIDSEKSNKQRVPLIIDSDFDFLNKIGSDPKAEIIPPVLADNGKMAQLMLADTSRQYLSIFVNLSLKDGYGLSVIRFAHRYRPSVPKFLIQNLEDKNEFLTRNFYRLGIQACIQKTDEYSKYLNFTSISNNTFDPKIALEMSRWNSDPVGFEKDFMVNEFIPILAENFISGSRSFFDLYVKLPSNRCIKILKAGESFSDDRLINYLNKGVTHFYLKKEAQEIYLNYCDQLASTLINKSKKTHQTKSNYTLNHGHEVMKFLQQEGIKSSTLEYAKNFIGNVQDLVKDTSKKSQDNLYLNGFLNSLIAYDHGVSVALIACMVGKELGIDSHSRIEVLGIAGMLHDIGLFQLPPETHEEDLEIMSQAVKEQYFMHPILGADILKTLPGIEPITVQAVLQHHERRNQLGFPNKIGPGSINRISELIGISDEFLKLIKKSKYNPKINPIKEIEPIISVGFSIQVVDSFRAVFTDKKNSSF